MLSYHNDPAVKLRYQARFAAHRAADEVVQGLGFIGGRGCFVGCTLDRYDHSLFPVELGWPEWLARLADDIFEGVPVSEAAQFGTDLLEAVQIGKDLEPVKWHLAIARHTVQIEQLKSNPEPYARRVRKAIQDAISHCQLRLAGPATEEKAAARSAAWSAESAAESAARSAARSAAWSAESAAAAAESAAESAAAAAAWSAAAWAAAAWAAARSAAAAAAAARSAAWSVESAAAAAAAAAARSSAWSAELAELADSAESAESEAAAWSAAWSDHFRWEARTLLTLLREM